MNPHPARNISFDQLHQWLEYNVSQGLVYRNESDDGLRLYCYTEETVYERKWNHANILARGIILDPVEKRVVATPFPKFFNIGEPGITIPDLPFEIFEKLDGSLIIIFNHNGKWRCATKGSFTSDQALWAQGWLDLYDLTHVNQDITLLAEAIYPENRIVVNYDKEGLFLLAAYLGDGREMPYADLCNFAHVMRWGTVGRHPVTSISSLLEKAKTLDGNCEGWVLRFSNGLRLKIKGEEYCRLHRLISNITPLAVWKVMKGSEQENEDLVAPDLETMRKELPEEFLNDFDTIVALLEERIERLIDRIMGVAVDTWHLSDKELGLRLHELPVDIRRFIFPYRKNNKDVLSNTLARRGIFMEIRPDRNVLPGYRASSSMKRVQENLKE